MDKFTNFTLDLFFPKFCLGCKKEGTYLCDDCRGLLDILEYQYCLCDKPNRLPSDQISGKCAKCSDKKLSGLYFALPYKEKALTKKLIYQFKYEPYLKDLAATLASILVEHLVISGKNITQLWENTVFIPVPLDKKKIKLRGYNQSAELAKKLSEILHVPVVLDCLVKVKITQSQMELSKKDREKNLENAFAIKNPEQIKDKKIFLVDDVYTTGSTMQECAKTLKNSGAKNVWGICLAREA